MLKNKCLNYYIALNLNPKSEADYSSILSYLYTENNKTENDFIRLSMDNLLSSTSWERVKYYQKEIRDK